MDGCRCDLTVDIAHDFGVDYRMGQTLDYPEVITLRLPRGTLSRLLTRREDNEPKAATARRILLAALATRDQATAAERHLVQQGKHA